MHRKKKEEMIKCQGNKKKTYRGLNISEILPSNKIRN